MSHVNVSFGVCQTDLSSRSASEVVNEPRDRDLCPVLQTPGERTVLLGQGLKVLSFNKCYGPVFHRQPQTSI